MRLFNPHILRNIVGIGTTPRPAQRKLGGFFIARLYPNTMTRLQTLRPQVQSLRVGQGVQNLDVTPGATKRKRGRAGQADRARVMRRDSGLCQSCKERGVLTAADEVDHTIPLEQGGADSDGNKRALCKACHAAKTARDRGYRVA